MTGTPSEPAQAAASGDATAQKAFRTPIGTHDLAPPESDRWVALMGAFIGLADRAGFGYLQTPIFEDIGVFARIGEGTDVVGKEMYEFFDRSDRHLALRPECTASVCRAFAQHRPTTPWKIWYQGPFFRYEAPQAGRYRQFHQIGAETLGTDDADADVEIIALAADFFAALGLAQVPLVLNSMGDADTRAAYGEALSVYLQRRVGDVDSEDRDKIERHPLRILDSKREATAAVAAEAPQITDFLSPTTAAHFERVREGLDALGVSHEVDPKLVRGLDYYTRTTFEFRAASLDAAQDTICGGGRYNGLVEALGGPPTPGIGFALGIERLLLACDAEGVFEVPTQRAEVWVVDIAGGAAARDLTHDLRSVGIRADRAFDDRSMRAQMRAADRSGAEIALIVGPDEAGAGTVTVRPLRRPDGGSTDEPQRTVARTDLLGTLRTVFDALNAAAGDTDGSHSSGLD
ncbi:histidine--tRNA ligase [Candidatus Poriferisodalis sp.]|uniref:histidine--tRNA ligase n=1 Tax=Candidatus Poriferisodalis sp. TaxID=3101277 RepID=UPI003B023733